MTTKGRLACAVQVVVSPFDWQRLMAGAKHIFPLFSEFAAYADPVAPVVRHAFPLSPGRSGTLASGHTTWCTQLLACVALRGMNVAEW